MKRLRLLSRLAIAGVAVLAAACSPNHMIGSQVNAYSVNVTLPVAMATDDIPLVCHSNESFIPLLMSFTQYNVDTSLMMAFAYTGAAACTEHEAVEKELWSMQAEKQGWINVAQDARIAQQLLNRDAGQRQLKAYQLMATYFRKHYRYDIGEGKCPRIRKDVEQHLLLVGATSALQALNNDIASGRLLNVDMELPAKVGRAMSCLDNDKWWGEPKAIQAALRTILPKDAADEAAAWSELQAATEIGLQTGVRLSHAIYASMAAGKDRDDLIRDALTRFEAIPPQALNEKYRLLDQMAALQVRHIADRYWMKHEGHRAPTINYSHFWDEKSAPDPRLNDILNSIN